MKVLIITYYWPPAGGSGVQRWMKFAKYLPDFGIEPIVYTPENADYPTTDNSLLHEVANIKVIQKRIFNPQDILPKKKRTTGVANISKGGLLSWVRGNFFIPDAKVFWVKPSVRFLSKYIQEHQIDLVISSGPPHSMHLIAEKVKRTTNVKWIADFRDPWTTLYYAEDFKLSKYAKAKNEKLERKILQNADAVITVSETISQELTAKGGEVTLIANGYDDEVLVKGYPLDDKFSIAHIGLLPKQSNPSILWEVLQDLSNTNTQFKQDLQISLTGNVSEETLSELKTFGLQDNVKQNGYVSHQKAIQFQKQAQVLLLLIPNTKNSKGILTGKLFEYITSNRPILAIGDTDGDVATILKDTQTGTIVDFEAKQQLKSVILSLYDAYKNQNLSVPSQDIEQYHRKELTRKLSQLIKKIK